MNTMQDACSAAESDQTSMADSISFLGDQTNRSISIPSNGDTGGRLGFEYEAHDEHEDKGELWEALNQNFRDVQSVLDQNRVLIQQVNQNHQSKIPENLAKNVVLIREINGNIGKVVSLYSNLSSSVSHILQQKKKLDRQVA